MCSWIDKALEPGGTAKYPLVAGIVPHPPLPPSGIEVVDPDDGATAMHFLLLYYRSQTKFAKVLFLHLSVILFTGRG